MEKWKIRQVKDVSPSPWFPIEQHLVELANGHLVDDYFITTLGDVVQVLPITSDGYIVLVQQYRHGQNDILLELPGGFVQEGKTEIESALAELEEETGIRAAESAIISLGKIAQLPSKSTQVSHGFLATGLTFNGVQKLDDLEEVDLVLKRPKEVVEMVLKGDIWVSDSVCFILKAFHLYPNLFS